MTVLVNSFEGGSNGTAITTANSGTAPDTAFSSVVKNTGVTVNFSSAWAHGGSLSALHTYGANLAGYTTWTSLAPATATTRVGARAYFQTPSTVLPSEQIVALRNASAQAAMFLLTASGEPSLQNSSGTILASNTGHALAGSTVYRVELYATPGTTTSNGTLEIYLYAGDSSTALWSFTSAAANAGTTAVTTVRYGRAAANLPASSMAFDDVYVDDALASGLIGPSVVTLSTTASMSAQVASSISASSIASASASISGAISSTQNASTIATTSASTANALASSVAAVTVASTTALLSATLTPDDRGIAVEASTAALSGALSASVTARAVLSTSATLTSNIAGSSTSAAVRFTTAALSAAIAPTMPAGSSRATVATLSAAIASSVPARPVASTSVALTADAATVVSTRTLASSLATLVADLALTVPASTLVATTASLDAVLDLLLEASATSQLAELHLDLIAATLRAIAVQAALAEIEVSVADTAIACVPALGSAATIPPRGER